MIRSILNVKGGVGKTTTAINLAAGLSKSGKKTLVIDLDGQANATRILTGKIFSREENTIVNAFLKEVDLKECIYPSNIENLYIVPANTYLFTIEKHMLLNSGIGIQQFKLRNMLKTIINDFDEIIIDNNPSLNLCATNSLCACDELIIPMNIDVGALDGIKVTLSHCNDILEGIEGVNFDYKILITMVNRNNTDKEIIKNLEKIYGNKIFKNKIRYQATPVKRAGLESSVLIDDLKSGVAEDYRLFIDEIINTYGLNQTTIK